MNIPLDALPAYETERLVVRPLMRKDAEAVCALTDDPAITGPVDFLSSPFTLADAADLIGRNDARNCFLGLWREGELVGIVGVHIRAEDQLEIGYWIGSAFQRRGYAGEGVASLLDRLSKLFPAMRINAECRVGNLASWRLLHRLGFRPVGEKGHRPGRELLLFGGR